MSEYNYEPQTPPMSVSRILRTLREYLPAITLSMIAVAVGYLIIAVLVYMFAPSSRVTSLGFRLEFDGAEQGEYPNGQKFSAAEIISTPILVKTFNVNNLGRFTKLSDFATSVFILQSNAAQEALAREYQARLADPRLSPVDRERIQREYEMKQDSLGKDQYAIHYVRKKRQDAVPEILARKALHDILRNWSEFVSNEQHVLEYRVAILSPDIVAGSAKAAGNNPIIETIMMRDKITRLLSDISRLRALPAAELARTPDGQTLADLSVRLDDVIRFRLDPLVDHIADARLDNRAETIRFLETQLAYDERRFVAQTGQAEAARRTLALYLNAQPSESLIEATAASRSEGTARTPGESETVMPQVSESFLDKLVQITTHSTDIEFRRVLAEEYQKELLYVVPVQAAVAYDKTLLALARSGGGGGGNAGGADRAAVAASLAEARAEIRAIAVKVNELHKTISRNLNPETELFATTTAPFSRVERTVPLKSLALWGILTLALALPIIVIICLLHNLVREEEGKDTMAAAQSPSATVSR